MFTIQIITDKGETVTVGAKRYDTRLLKDGESLIGFGLTVFPEVASTAGAVDFQIGTPPLVAAFVKNDSGAIVDQIALPKKSEGTNSTETVH